MKKTDNQKRILVVSQNFYPETFRINDIVEELVKRDFKVDVLTSLPNYPEGRFYKGYGVFKRGPKEYKGARLYRCAVFPRLKNSNIGISLNYATFPITSFFRILGLLFKKYDSVFVYQVSPIFQCIPALVYGFFKPKANKIIYTLDIWPESVYSVVDIKSPFIRRVLYAYCKKVYKKFHKVLVTSKGFIPLLQQRGVDPGRMEYLPQWAEDLYTREIEDNPLREIYGRTFNILFAGNIGIPQGMDIILDAAEKTLELPNLRWILVGDGDAYNDLKAAVEARNLTGRVIMTGRKPLEDMPYYYDIADALFACLKDIELFAYTVPAKIQSYMAAGKPLVTAINGECIEIVKESGCGLYGPAGDAAELANNVRKFYNMPEEDRRRMGETGRKYYLENFNREMLLQKLCGILNEK